jgi:nitrate/TMAO reductase-like tetraheme cytochrome c subunit
MAKQKEFAQQMHAGRKAANKTCIDCHMGIAHDTPSE